MARPIDADEAKKALTGWGTYPTDEEIEHTIDELPTVEAAPVVHGRWIGPFRVDANHNGYKCSVCGYFGVPGWVACPNCGARMDGDGSA